MDRAEIRPFAQAALRALDNPALSASASLESARFDLAKIWLFGRQALNRDLQVRLGTFILETSSLGDSVITWRQVTLPNWGEQGVVHWHETARTLAVALAT